jgi:hypothetical protein
LLLDEPVISNNGGFRDVEGLEVVMYSSQSTFSRARIFAFVE